MVAGSSALHLLAEESPGSLDALSDEDWEFWTPMVVAHRDGQPSARNLVLATAYDRAPNIFIATLEGVIDGENERIGQLTVLRDLGTLWSDELAAALREKIAGLKPKAFKNAIEILLDKADLKTREFARAMATGHVPATGEERSRIVYAAVELLSHNPDEWKMLWPIFRNDEAFCVEVLETTAYENEFNSFAMQLDAREVADLCIWLAGRGLEKIRPDPKDLGLITPSVALARWWNVLINSLTLRGTPDSCAALEELVAALPKYQDGLQNSLRRAQELTRRMSWDPPSLGDVLNIARYDKTLRLVISVHGIRTRGAWQKEVNSDLQKAGFRHELLDYGYFWAFQLVIL